MKFDRNTATLVRAIPLEGLPGTHDVWRDAQGNEVFYVATTYRSTKVCINRKALVEWLDMNGTGERLIVCEQLTMGKKVVLTLDQLPRSWKDGKSTHHLVDLTLYPRMEE